MGTNRREFLFGAVAFGLGVSAGSISAQETKRGGLGFTGAEWIELWGEPDKEVKDKYWKAEYHDPGADVRLMYLEPDQHIIGFDLYPTIELSREVATPIVEKYLPEDAVYQSEYGRPYGDPGAVVVYNSPWLADRFLNLNDPVISDWFPEGIPGDFVVIYQESTEKPGLLGIVIGLGNNP